MHSSNIVSRIQFAAATAVALLFAVALPGTAAAQSFAVVALDAEARTAELDSEIANNLRNAGIGAVSGEELTDRLEARQSDEPDEELLRRFAALTTSIGTGVNEYYHLGNDKAIDLLSPAFDLGVNNREVLARRPDYAEQIYSAGVILVRAYQAEGSTESANAVISILARHFPSKTASAATVPPKVIKPIESEKEAIAAQGATLEFAGIGENCTTYLNGFPVTGKVSVVPDLTYYARHDCGRERTPTWKVRTTRGQSVVVPLLSSPHTEFELKSASVRDRDRAEALMAAITFWTGVDGVVAASTHGANDAEVVVGRWMPKGTAWSDGISSRNLQGALSRVFPELDEEQFGAAASDNEVVESSTSNDGPGALPWIAIVGGTAIAGVGVYLWFAAEALIAEVECSPDTATTGRDCSGVEGKFFSAEEVDSARSRVDTQRIGAYASWGVGAVAIGYGIIALLMHDSGEPTTALFVGPTPNGAAAGLRIRF